MPKNKYPDSLGLADCSHFSEIFLKLHSFYGHKKLDYKEVIIEILMQQHEIDRSGSHFTQMQMLFEFVAKDYIPDTYKASGGLIRDNERKMDEQSSKTRRQAHIVAMFILVMGRGVSQNRAADIIESKGMNKGVKRRYHEARKNEVAVGYSSLLVFPAFVVDEISRIGNTGLSGLESLIKKYNELN